MPRQEVADAAPSARVAIDPNGSRISAGASGVGSNVSRWLAPPWSKITSRAVRPPSGLVPVLSLSASRSARERPVRPAFRNSRIASGRSLPPTHFGPTTAGPPGVVIEARPGC
jgi:hypothetical protein